MMKFARYRLPLTVLFFCCGVALFALASCGGAPPPGKPETELDSPFIPHARERVPMLAVWLQSDGMRRVSDQRAPSLRYAIWEDGTVVFANDPKEWGSGLRRGKLGVDQVARIKEQIAGSGIFGLQRTHALVPDAPAMCMAVRLEGKKQVLYWDEREMPSYGINIAPTADDLEFIRCWKFVNRVGVGARPPGSEAVAETFLPPKEWR